MNPAMLTQRLTRIHRTDRVRQVPVVHLVGADSVEARLQQAQDDPATRDLFVGLIDGPHAEAFLDGARLTRLMQAVAAVAGTNGERSDPFAGIQSPVGNFRGFLFCEMPKILIDTDALKSLDRHEVFLLLCLSSRTKNGVVWLTMEKLQHITHWPYKKVLSTTTRLVEKGIIENIPTEDTTGKVAVKYRIVSDLVEKIDTFTFSTNNQ